MQRHRRHKAKIEWKPREMDTEHTDKISILHVVFSFLWFAWESSCSAPLVGAMPRGNAHVCLFCVIHPSLSVLFRFVGLYKTS